MMTLLVGDDEKRLPSDDLRLEAPALHEAIGWSVEEHGLCRGDVCVPARLTLPVALTEVAALLGRPIAAAVLPDGEVVVAVGEPGQGDGTPRDPAGPLVLPDVDGAPLEVGRTGRKTAVVAWSSWCGCRYELPAWKELADELAAEGLDVVTVALDEDPEAVRPWLQDGLPTAVDREHRLSDLFGVAHVPSTVWLDEDGAVVKPPTLSPGDDTFRDFTEVDSAGHHEALRRWVREGQAPDIAPPSDDADLRAARAERRLAAWLHRNGHADLAEEHFVAAVALAPLDFSIRRGSMPLRGQDPFGTEFFALWEEWQTAGRPGYEAL